MADINAAFIPKYETQTGTTLEIRQSHGGSATEARAVIDGLEADVVTLAIFPDTDAIRKAGRISAGREKRLPNNYTEEAQAIIAKNFYRPIDPAVRERSAKELPRDTGGPPMRVGDAWRTTEETDRRRRAGGAPADRSVGARARGEPPRLGFLAFTPGRTFGLRSTRASSRSRCSAPTSTRSTRT